jgi:hypothetical protein
MASSLMVITKRHAQKEHQFPKQIRPGIKRKFQNPPKQKSIQLIPAKSAKFKIPSQQSQQSQQKIPTHREQHFALAQKIIFEPLWTLWRYHIFSSIRKSDPINPKTQFPEESQAQEKTAQH